MNGKLDLETLTRRIEQGEIDTVLVCFPDMQGRLMGKRVPDVPKTLREALAAFKKSQVLRAAFGDPVVDHYLHAGEWEQAEYDRRVTDWELIRYFERA